MADQTRLIKKHANRRLYDTQNKKYVSLDDILETIMAGTDVRVEDSKSGEDISRLILLQIIAECEQRGRPMLSPGMLTVLIRQYGHPMQDYVGPYLEQSLGYYLKQIAALRRRMSDMFGEGAEKRNQVQAGLERVHSMRDNLMQILKKDRDS